MEGPMCQRQIRATQGGRLWHSIVARVGSNIPMPWLPPGNWGRNSGKITKNLNTMHRPPPLDPLPPGSGMSKFPA